MPTKPTLTRDERREVRDALETWRRRLGYTYAHMGRAEGVTRAAIRQRLRVWVPREDSLRTMAHTLGLELRVEAFGWWLRAKSGGQECE